MERRNLLKTLAGSALVVSAGQAFADESANTGKKMAMDEHSQASFDTVMAFMSAMGKGDKEGMSKLMADDMIWHNEGDKTLPWIGEQRGKDNIFKLLKIFSSNMKSTLWETEDAFAFGDTVAMFGRMNGITTNNGNEIGEFTFALRAKVRDGKLVLWNWFEDSFALSKAYHG